jgi:hypothetical protein
MVNLVEFLPFSQLEKLYARLFQILPRLVGDTEALIKLHLLVALSSSRGLFSPF